MTQTRHAADVALKSAITAELNWTAGLDGANIGVGVTDGAVTLSGEVGSYPEKRRAEGAAIRVRGVRAIAEEITVRTRHGSVNDTDIAREADEALKGAVDVPDGSVSAVVHNHVITLSGHVPWNFQREAAGRSVRYLKGVTGLENTVTIQSAVSASGVKAAITAALVRSAQCEGEHTIVVTDTGGTVTLGGTVHSMTERRDAERAAWSAPGVSNVVNELLVQN